jgi:hypothetical protein
MFQRCPNGSSSWPCRPPEHLRQRLAHPCPGRTRVRGFITASIAIERDLLTPHGGEVLLRGEITVHTPGLTDRLKKEHLQDNVQIVDGDFLDPSFPEGRCDAVWTSCSWHYSINHRRPLAEFVTRMQHLLRANGLFGQGRVFRWQLRTLFQVHHGHRHDARHAFSPAPQRSSNYSESFLQSATREPEIHLAITRQ